MDLIPLTPVISISRRCRPRMPRKQDLEALREFLKHADTRAVALALQMMGCLDGRLVVGDITWGQIFQILVFRDYSFVSSDDLCRRFFDHGYQDLARSLFLYSLYAESQSQSLVTVKRSVPANKKTIHLYFKNLKRLVHNAQFKDPRSFFRKQARLLQNQIQHESAESKRQFLADKYIALLGAEIDAIAITYDVTLPDQDIFTELKSLAVNSTDASISEVVFFGRKANALAIAKKFSEGEDMVKQAHCCANFTGPCLEIANMIYIDVYFKLWQFEQTPTTELKESLLYEGSKGLWALSEEEEEIRNLWKRMFLLRMIFCLVGLSNKGRCIPGCVIREEDMDRAEKYMNEIDLKDIEARREMMYYIAKARIKQLRRMFDDANTEIDRAEAIAQSGNFKEIDSIMVYRSLLRKLGSETEVKTVIDEQHEDLADAPSLLIPSLESLGLIETRDSEETSVKVELHVVDTVGNQPHNFDDIVIERSPYNSWSVLGGQFPSASSSGQSDKSLEYSIISKEPVQETHHPRMSSDRPRNSVEPVQNIPLHLYSELEIKDATKLDSLILNYRNDQHVNQVVTEQDRNCTTLSTHEILSDDDIRLRLSSFDND